MKLLATSCLVLVTPLLAHVKSVPADWKPTAYADKLAHAPRPLPDRIVLTWTGDPPVSQSVTWRTDSSVMRAMAEITLANENGRDLKGQPVPARTEFLTSDLGEAAYHSATFTELRPDTLYAYRV